MLRAEFGAAVMLLTRLPARVIVGDRPIPDPARCVWAYPLVGSLIGLGGAFWFDLCRVMSMPPLLASVWSWAGIALLTGALHEDGLADMADGFGGGRTRERKLDIMRDSRIGSYGVLALVLATATRVVALAAVPHPVPVMVTATTLSRAAMMVPALLPPARLDGMGAGLGRIGLGAVLTSAGLACLIGFIQLPAGVAVCAIGVACGTALATAGLARAQIGGFTGDVLGGCVVVTECAVLTLLACQG